MKHIPDYSDYIGKKAYKTSRGMYGGLVGTIEWSNNEITPLILNISNGAMRLGVNPSDLVIVDESVEKER